MTAWETEDEYAAAAAASLPTPTDTPYRTPSRSSRKSSRRKSKSPDAPDAPSSSPPRRRDSKDMATDESISILDPRRFTPTLHANLVSEILNLRRDQEDKIKTIERLEADLQHTHGEHDLVESSLVATAKENRSLKRQLALLEGGTSSALSELARERDEAVDSNGDIKRRLDTAQKKIRNQEENADRVQELWTKDKDNWDDERRKLERKIHVAEGRLKTVLDEVAAYQASQQQPETEAEDASRDHALSDAGSVRSMSMTNSVRFSMLNGPVGYGGAKSNGISLADELDLEEDDDAQTDPDGRESVLSVRHNRTQSRESVFSKHHRRTESNDSLVRSGSAMKGRLLANQATFERLGDGILEDDESIQPKDNVKYVDTGIQYSPPATPELHADIPGKPIQQFSIDGMNDSNAQVRSEKQEPDYLPREWEIEANQRRKRVHAGPPLVIEPPVERMVSAASQTLSDPPSPPKTPISPTRAAPPPPIRETTREMISISTQTDAPALQSPTRAPPPPPIPIPSIQLHPPSSAPASPRLPLHFLPQHFKDAGSQVNMQVPVPSRSISVQTEEIRVDKRMNLLPPHLQPSSISSSPPSPEPGFSEDSKRFSPVPGNLPPRNPRRMKSNPRVSLEQEIPSSPPQFLHAETRDAYPGNNDDGPLTKDKGSIRRPHRISSLFAGFENVSSDDGDEFADGDNSDNDYRTPLSPNPQSITNRMSKFVPLAPTSASRSEDPVEGAKASLGQSLMKQYNNEDESGELGSAVVQIMAQKGSTKPVRQLDKPLTLVTTNKSGIMRRAALIQSGVAAHAGRSRSPSLPEPIKEPPFPIPTRASSRRPPVSASAPSDRSRSPTWGRGSGRGHYRANSIRKVRSAAAISRNGRSVRRRGSRSPPPMSPSTEAPESPKLPPMPNNDITSPRYMKETSSSRFRTHRQQPSVTTANTANTTNTAISESSSQATSVVDAIAQTMVGEWMFKYVRRRKSFGVNDGGIEGEGARHKRWVWLAPYERAVMWSSKQPTSGSALMGKTGRKLTIQSVLDVKDENFPPKGTTQIFNRSILILTPARALKFTAISAERHYVWLTALSFLAHSSHDVPEIIEGPLPIARPSIPDFEVPHQGPARLRKNGIRDSIRVAKGKTAPARSGPTSVHSSQFGGTEPSIREAGSFYSTRNDAIPTAADPPVVPRFPERNDRNLHGPPLTHNRKRSNTGSRIPPPLSFRGFSGPVPSHAPTASTALSTGTNGSSDIYQLSQPASSMSAGYNGMSASGRSSVRTSEASSRPGAVVNNFFDAVGTVRMEAFISPIAFSRIDDYPDEKDEMDMIALRRRRSRDRRRRSRNTDSYYSSRGRMSDDWYSGSKTAGEEEYGHFDSGLGHDPFRGF